MQLITAESPLSHDAIGKYAEMVADHHKVVGSDGHVDVFELVEKLGGSWVVRDGSESIDIKGHKDFEIHLPLLTSKRRDRFTVAHELGHYFVHYMLPGHTENAKFERGGRGLLETQANVFASALLMPSAAFVKAHAKYDGDSGQLSRIFDVSRAAVQVRQQVLGLTVE